MEQFNPYAPPASEDIAAAPSRLRRGGKGIVIVPAGTDFPARCVKCNAPAPGPRKLRTMYWHHPAWYLLILVSLLIYVIAALIARKSVQLSPGLCPAHATARGRRLLASISTFALSMLLSIYFLMADQDVAFGVTLVVTLVSMFYAAIAARIVYPVRITETETELKGCGAPFLASIGGGLGS